MRFLHKLHLNKTSIIKVSHYKASRNDARKLSSLIIFVQSTGIKCFFTLSVDVTNINTIFIYLRWQRFLKNIWRAVCNFT